MGLFKAIAIYFDILTVSYVILVENVAIMRKEIQFKMNGRLIVTLTKSYAAIITHFENDEHDFFSWAFLCHYVLPPPVY